MEGNSGQMFRDGNKSDGIPTLGNQEQSPRQVSWALVEGQFHPEPEVVLLPAQKCSSL